MNDIIAVLRAAGWDEELLATVQKSVEVDQSIQEQVDEEPLKIMDFNGVSVSGMSFYAPDMVAGFNP